MEVEFRLTIRDMEAFARYQLKHGTRLKPRVNSLPILWLLVIIVPLSLFSALPTFFGPMPNIDLSAAMPFVYGLLLGFVLTLLLLVWFRKRLLVRNTRLLYEGKEYRWIFRPRRFSISADGFSEQSEFVAMRGVWDIVDRLGVTEEHIFLYTTRTQAHIVPRRAFRDAQHFETFIEQIRAYLDGEDDRGARSSAILDALPASSPSITPKDPL